MTAPNPPPMSTKTFPTTAVLTLATGTVMGEFSEAHGLIQHFARGPVWTHQIPLLHDEIEQCARQTLGAGYEPFEPTNEGWEAYRDRMVAKLGPAMEVAQPDKPFHRADAALADAIEAVGPERLIVVGADQKDSTP
jgi:hypothetical protein